MQSISLIGIISQTTALQKWMSELYQSFRTNVMEHIRHIYEDEELNERQPVGYSDRFKKKAKETVQ